MRVNPKLRLVLLVVSTVWVFATGAFGLTGFTLIAPLALIAFAFVRPFRAPVIGILAGWFILLYDEDFGLNAGGPEAPIQKAIRNCLGLRWDNDTAPVLLVMLAGCCAGLLYRLMFMLVTRAEASNER